VVCVCYTHIYLFLELACVVGEWRGVRCRYVLDECRGTFGVGMFWMSAAVCVVVRGAACVVGMCRRVTRVCVDRIAHGGRVKSTRRLSRCVSMCS
jgi:hypothetical protein